MMGQHSPAACCCTFCEDCCNGNEPTEFDADFTFTDLTCDTCDSFVSGTYTLVKFGPCRWAYSSGLIAGQYCVSPYPANDDKIYGIDIALTILCINDTQYRVTLTMTVYRSYFSGTETQYGGGFSYATYNGIGSDVYKWEVLVNFTDFTCDTVANYSLTFVNKTAFRSFYWNDPFNGPQFVSFTAPPNATSYNTWDIRYYCSPATTAEITAVP